MNIDFITEDNLIIKLSGELDHNALKKARERLEMKVTTTPKKIIIIDLDNLEFMDSSGISLVYNINKIAISLNKKTYVLTNNEKFEKILTLAKIDTFVKIIKDYKKEV